MKRVRKKRWIPRRLFQYRKKHPHQSWQIFHQRNKQGYRDIKKQLLKDQYGLCAYCEIRIKMAEEENQVDDFRVEHFHPKSLTSEGGHNYHLDWYNMLGVCHGGSQPLVAESEQRYSPHKWNRTCDVPKGNKPIHNLILNPLRIPADKRLFRYDSFTGEMFVDKKSCPENLIKKAKNTIRELNLNAPRLARLRKAVIDELTGQLEAGLMDGMAPEEIFEELARSLLIPDEERCYPNFFTVIRWFLGEEAEEFLAERKFRI